MVETDGKSVDQPAAANLEHSIRDRGPGQSGLARTGVWPMLLPIGVKKAGKQASNLTSNVIL